MLTIQEIKTRKLIPDQLYDLNDLPEFLLSQKHFDTRKRLLKKFSFIKRISPFLIASISIVVLFIYSLINHTENMPGKWFLFFLMVFIEINILMMDFALWNYYEGKKKTRIWVIELSIVFLVLYFAI